MVINDLSFEDFIKSLQETNIYLNYFVDFEKCGKNLKKIPVHLNTLNYLLGKRNLKDEIDFLYSQIKSVLVS